MALWRNTSTIPWYSILRNAIQTNKIMAMFIKANGEEFDDAELKQVRTLLFNYLTSTRR